MYTSNGKKLAQIYPKTQMGLIFNMKEVSIENASWSKQRVGDESARLSELARVSELARYGENKVFPLYS